MNFRDGFSENAAVWISWKSVQWETCCSMRTGRQTDRQADMTKLTLAFHDFTKTPEKSLLVFHHWWITFSNFLSITPKSTFCYEEHAGLLIGLQAGCRIWAPILSPLCNNCCLTLRENVLSWRYKAVGFEWRRYESNLNVSEANSAQSIKITLKRIKAQVRMCWSNLPCSSECLYVIGPIVRKLCHVIK